MTERREIRLLFFSVNRQNQLEYSKPRDINFDNKTSPYLVSDLDFHRVTGLGKLLHVSTIFRLCTLQIMAYQISPIFLTNLFVIKSKISFLFFRMRYDVCFQSFIIFQFQEDPVKQQRVQQEPKQQNVIYQYQ